MAFVSPEIVPTLPTTPFFGRCSDIHRKGWKIAETGALADVNLGGHCTYFTHIQGGGGLPGGRGERGAGRVSTGNWGGGPKYFFSGPKFPQSNRRTLKQEVSS